MNRRVLAFLVSIALLAILVLNGAQSLIAAQATDMLVWVTRASMPTARAGLGVTTASNGKIYAIGGDNGSGGHGGIALATVEEYDPATDTWVTRASMPTARTGLGVTTASNDKIYAIGGNLNGNILATVEEYDPATDTWVTRASMPTARAGLGVVSASNGQIYAIGGYNVSGQHLATVEAYDPAADMWVTRASMPTTRVHLGAAAASNGKIYVIGGFTGNSLTTPVEEYDPATDIWTPRAGIPTGRGYLGVTTASNGKIYAIGGYNVAGFLATAEEYDPATDSWVTLDQNGMFTTRCCLGVVEASNGKLYAIGGHDGGPVLATVAQATTTPLPPVSPSVGVWSLTGSLAEPRYDFGIALLQNGKVLVTAGRNVWDHSVLLASSELYDPASGTWSATGSLNTARFWFGSLVILNSGKVLIAGGSNTSGEGNFDSAEVYDPVTGRWSYTGSLNTPRRGATLTLLDDGRVLIAGGARGPADRNRFLASTEIYDPATGTWSYTGNMNVARDFHSAVRLHDGRVLIAGGEGRSGFLNQAEIYNPATGTWSTAGTTSVSWWQVASMTVLHDGKVLVAGGFDNGAVYSNADLYDPITGRWTPTSPMNVPRTGQATLLPDGRVLVSGGNNAGGTLASSEIYNPATGTWSFDADLQVDRAGHLATMLPNGQVLVAGGWRGHPETGALASVELYTIGDLVPIVNAGPDATILEGDTFSSSGSFIDPDPNSWTATVDYGDGSGSQPLSLNPDKTFTLNHTYVNAGLYNVTVTVTDDASGQGVDTVTVTVLTPQQATQNIINNVQMLVTAGVLNQGQGNALMAKLQAAIQQMDQGSLTAASNQLQAFINQVNAFIKSGTLSAVQGQALIDAANNVINYLHQQTSVAANKSIDMGHDFFLPIIQSD